jgi:hypothetical protein
MARILSEHWKAAIKYMKERIGAPPLYGFKNKTLARRVMREIAEGQIQAARCKLQNTGDCS